MDAAKVKYYHASGVVRWIGSHARLTQYHPNPTKKRHWQAAVKYWSTVKHNAWLVMHPAPRVLVSTTSHYSMWLCIHAKEGAWNANTGNGYYGGLQMTSGWGGVSRPDLLSPASQIALAESGYAASGYSLAWLRQQWPNTSYGCV